MTNSYRIKLYLFGFLMGLLILMFVLKGKKCSGVSEMKLVELTDQYNFYSDKVKCQLNCFNIPVDSFRAVLARDFHINYDKSEVQAVPCGKYFVEPIKKDQYPFSLVMLDCDTTSHIEQLIWKDSGCNCDSLSTKVNQ